MLDPLILRDYLLLFLLPLWTVVGLADWLCHRRAGIERFGTYEPILHLVLILLAGAPILLGLFLEINAPVIVVMLLCFAVHEAVGYVDIRWANSRRGILPIEQRLHDYLAAVPFAALSFVIVLKWTVVEFLIHAPAAALADGLYFRLEPLPLPIIAAILTLVALFNVLPYAEEFLRARKYSRRLSGRP